MPPGKTCALGKADDVLTRCRRRIWFDGEMRRTLDRVSCGFLFAAHLALGLGTAGTLEAAAAAGLGAGIATVARLRAVDAARCKAVNGETSRDALNIMIPLWGDLHGPAKGYGAG